MMSNSVHKSVLLKEVLQQLELKNGDVVIDATLGGGGHSRSMLEKILPDGKLIAFDVNHDAIEQFKEQQKKHIEEGKIILVHENFQKIELIRDIYGVECVNALLADLGYSSDQIESKEFGMSFLVDAPLDMRLDKRKKLNAADIVNSYSLEDLKKIFHEYGDEKFSAKIASRIIEKRIEKPITSTVELAQIVESAIPARFRKSKIHSATKVFQALRIEVNNEFEALSELIQSGIEILCSGGRMAIISFHSGEDRMVKNLFKEFATGCICPPQFPKCICGKKPIAKIITTKPIISGSEEIEKNVRSRSAKLRIIEKI